MVAPIHTGNMAHIANLMVSPTSNSVGLNNYIARELSPHPSNESITESPASDDKGKEKFVWRLQQPLETRKYQLFPAKDKLLSITSGRNSPDPEQAFAIAMGTANNGSDRPIVGTAMRLKAKEISLLRRRKPSLSELGPMTTVQEIAMDSPTIPGRPPLHERSTSAPGHNPPRRKASGLLLDGTDECVASNAQPTTSVATVLVRRRSGSPKGPLSPRALPPLVIPSTTGPAPQRAVAKPQSSNKLDSSLDKPPTVPPKSANDKFSPYTRTPYTPMSGSTYTPMTASTTNLSILSSATPISASEGRISPFPSGPIIRGPSPIGHTLGHTRGQSDTSANRSSCIIHRREQSETSVMDRGRPKRRPDASLINHKRTLSKQSQLAVEKKAFETLPEGFKAIDTSGRLPKTELDALKYQAIGQAAKFDVLCMKDVESLSRELRALDERCEYLRKTHHSLRSGRRNLHERICTYLRSPRTAQFSPTSILKQEEALIELDLSIDDWVSKLEQAENRRTRVRQKLLEHVAAALTIPDTNPKGEGASDNNIVVEKDQIMKTTMALNRHISMGEDTPPRSPTRECARIPSPTPEASPERLALPIQAHTPVTETDPSRMSKESIRIYADSDVYALLADVENEINRMTIVQEENLEILSAVTFSGPVPSRTGSPVVRDRTASPAIRDRTASPAIRDRTASPAVQNRTASPMALPTTA